MAYVLIVDDDEDFSEAVATLLTSHGHEVAVEHDIDYARENMRNRPPDLVVLDVMFPEDSTAGFTFTRQIRAEEGDLAKVPLIMLTAVNTKFPLGFGPEDIHKDWLPVQDFVEKPVDFGVLMGKIDKLLSNTQEK